MPRPQKSRCICSVPEVKGFTPVGCKSSGSTNLTYDEYEVIRLLDYMKMTQEDCAVRMDVSRPTVTRIYTEARRKLADMLVNGRNLTIGGGDVTVCREIRPECRDEVHCCHKDPNLLRGRRNAEIFDGEIRKGEV